MKTLALEDGRVLNWRSFGGRLIASAAIEFDGVEDGNLVIRFEDGSRLRLRDDMQSCCESRYMRSDDDLAGLAGSRLIDIEVRDGPDQETDWGGDHEVQFLLITTTSGTVTIANHNEHNGYYGGFNLVAEQLGPAD